MKHATICDTVFVKKIDYPGTGNSSQFSYDGSGQNVQIVESSGGTTTSTKQFVWCDNARCEIRDASGAITAQCFDYGEILSGSPYFYTFDHNTSVRELLDSSMNVASQYAYDPFGQASKLKGSLDSDFRYAGYYQHSRSGLSSPMYKFYSPTLARFINRDPAGEGGGLNLYTYVLNDPIDSTDLSGLSPNDFVYDSVDSAVTAGFTENRALVLQTRKSHTEMGFWVYKKDDSKCGKWAYSTPFTSPGVYITVAQAEANKPAGIIGGFAHSHPDKRPWWNTDVGYENFSISDIRQYRQYNYTGYLYNAYDQLKVFKPGCGDPPEGRLIGRF